MRIIKFLDRHRFLLVLLILFLISGIFFGIKSFLFLHHDFESLKCNLENNDDYCYFNDTLIFKNPDAFKKNFFNENKSKINDLKKKYALPNFSFFTSYYYEVASEINYKMTGENKELHEFFIVFNRTYDLINFYKKNTFYFEIYYPYKIY